MLFVITLYLHFVLFIVSLVVLRIVVRTVDRQKSTRGFGTFGEITPLIPTKTRGYFADGFLLFCFLFLFYFSCYLLLLYICILFCLLFPWLFFVLLFVLLIVRNRVVTPLIPAKTRGYFADGFFIVLFCFYFICY